VADDAGEGDVSIERGVRYGPKKRADVYRPRRVGPAPLALLWHGVGPDDRAALGPLATAVARLGVAVVVPDWRSDAPDGGRAHLLASLDFTRELARDRPAELATSAASAASDDSFVLAGWSRGGRMATSLALNPAVAGGWRPSAVVCLAAGYYQATPMSVAGRSPIDDLAVTRAKPVPFRLVHGTRDTVIGIQQSRDFAAAAAGRGWPVQLTERDTDHGGVIGPLSARIIACAGIR
jgi:dienelactone hydrolase